MSLFNWFNTKPKETQTVQVIEIPCTGMGRRLAVGDVTNYNFDVTQPRKEYRVKSITPITGGYYEMVFEEL